MPIPERSARVNEVSRPSYPSYEQNQQQYCCEPLSVIHTTLATTHEETHQKRTTGHRKNGSAPKQRAVVPLQRPFVHSARVLSLVHPDCFQIPRKGFRQPTTRIEKQRQEQTPGRTPWYLPQQMPQQKPVFAVCCGFCCWAVGLVVFAANTGICDAKTTLMGIRP